MPPPKLVKLVPLTLLSQRSCVAPGAALAPAGRARGRGHQDAALPMQRSGKGVAAFAPPSQEPNRAWSPEASWRSTRFTAQASRKLVTLDISAPLSNQGGD